MPLHSRVCCLSRLPSGFTEAGARAHREPAPFPPSHDRKGFIFDFDQMGGLAGGEAVAGHDHGHFVAVIADVLGQQKAVGHVSMRRVHGVGMSGCGEEEARHVIGGEDGLDAGRASASEASMERTIPWAMVLCT